MILDVGCGGDPKGDVNVDLYPMASPHRAEAPDIDLRPQKIPNFVLADGQHLPFKSNSFDIVYSFHLIEHVNNPSLLVWELIRVASRKVILKCPHRYHRTVRLGFSRQCQEHKNFFWLSLVS
jgi:ubiquinone/menaquinone biosynthesis C-methylase UbiE